MADKIRVNSKYDMRGNYEPSDSEDEYSDGEKELLNNVRTRGAENSDSEENVYGFSESDDESDQKADIADSDVEGQEQSDNDLPDTKAWGKQKRTYYATDYVDEDYGGFGNDEEAALMEEQEAKNIQRRLLEQLGDEDFTIESLTKPREEKEEASTTVIKSDLGQLSKRQKLQLLEKESPELSGLIQDFKSKLSVAKDDLQPVLELMKDGKLPTCPASNFVKTNYNLILNYCTNISFYVLLKSQRVNIQNHPVVKRLYQYRQMLNKMEPIYSEVIKPQISSILEAISNNVQLQADISNELSKRSKKRKSTKNTVETVPKKLKLTSMEKDDGKDTGVSDNEEDYEGDDVETIARKNNDESEESGFSDNDGIVVKHDQPTTSQITEEIGDKREITYQMAKNKGLTPHRKKEQRNPRVKHKLKFRKAKIRRKGAVREPRFEINRYAGEASGIKSNVKKGIKIK